MNNGCICFSPTQGHYNYLITTRDCSYDTKKKNQYCCICRNIKQEIDSDLIWCNNQRECTATLGLTWSLIIPQTT